MQWFGREPAVIISLIGGALIAAIEVIAPELFPDLEALIVQSVQVIVGILTVLVVRANVWSPATHEAEIAAARMGE